MRTRLIPERVGGDETENPEEERDAAGNGRMTADCAADQSGERSRTAKAKAAQRGAAAQAQAA